jgi:hypothetical protein
MSQRPRVLIESGVEPDRAAREAGRHRRRRVHGPWAPSLSGVVTLLARGCALVLLVRATWHPQGCPLG